ncbi:MAG: nucleotidyl transferase AbiEii/AbiGii toxin family protein, partial [Proteobacteria bacterium]|nr:nucleotidyl transferase AbiEii/AbiGii toxin family protein [Pseudomonadota bacterium]
MQAHFEALPKETQSTFALLASFRGIESFYLAGGTALALAFGHRVSVDLDFFSRESFGEQILINRLSTLDGFSLEKREEGTIHANINITKISFFHYPYSLLEAPKVLNGIQIASVRDIACMKLEAISQRGAKRDFVDLYTIAQHGSSLSEIFFDYQKKYEKLNVNMIHVKKGLVYFDDAEEEPMPRMLKPLEWKTVKNFFYSEA